MMMPGKESGDDFGSSRLLHDIEEISKALYLHHAPPKALSVPPYNTPQKPKYINHDLVQNDKKSSIWKWKPLKALTHIRNHRLNCSFFLHVRSIEGLPQNFNDLSLCVYWKRKHEILKSHSTRVQEGVAEFEETLMHQCSIYINKSGPHDDVAKYKPKFSLLYASIVGAPNLDLGKHRIDLTRLLPITLMELEEEKNHYKKWMTSFKLTGKAKGATINVSFGFSLSGDNFMRSRNLGKVPNVLKGSGASHNGMLRRVRSIPSNSSRRTHGSSLSLDINAHNGIVPYERPSISFLYELLGDGKSSYSKELNVISAELDNGGLKSESSHETEVFDSEFTVIDKGIEFSQLKIEEDRVISVETSSIETIDVAEIFECYEEMECKERNEVCGNLVIETHDDIRCKENDVCTEESTIEELESLFDNLSISESPNLGFSFPKSEFLDRDYHMMNMPICEGGKMLRSYSLDDLTDTVVNDFMNLVGSDSEPESPRERLLRQFEKETLASGNILFDLNAKEEQEDCYTVFDSSFLFQGAEIEHGVVGPSLIGRRKAKMIENLETEALMQEWGLNEGAFENSPRNNSGAFGSPVYLSPEQPPELPPLGEGLSSFLKTKSGGFLRSINPSLFKRAKNGERLIVQVSNSVVLPATMGSNGMDILLKWATVGAEKMLLQTAKLMPVEEITGKTLQQAAWEAESRTEVLERGHGSLNESEAKEISTSICGEIDSESVLLGNIVLMAIEKIQYLLIEGLRVQSGMSNEEPPSSISIKCIGENMASPSSDFFDIDELIGMSISLEEWMRLDYTYFGDEHEVSDHISKTLEADHVKMDPKRINKFGNLSDHYGYFSKFTLALQLLLRDPLRDYEPVGIPMLALVQVERSDVEGAPIVEPMFKITEVHVTGFRADPRKKQQSGSRWLHSSRMTANPKRHPLSKSNALVQSSSYLIHKAKHEDILWSISSYVHGEVAKWKELSALTLYVRNPDIVFK